LSAHHIERISRPTLKIVNNKQVRSADPVATRGFGRAPAYLMRLSVTSPAFGGGPVRGSDRLMH